MMEAHVTVVSDLMGLSDRLIRRESGKPEARAVPHYDPQDNSNNWWVRGH
jgi:hypothetical protein